MTNYATTYMAHANDEPHVYEFITVEWVRPSPSGKTSVYRVLNTRSGDTLGIIKWHGPWRQYVFVVAPNTLYSRGCLNDIASFIEGLR